MNAARAVAEFCERYRSFLFVVDEAIVDPITEESIWANFQENDVSAGGMDGCEPIELKFMSKRLCDWVASMLALIEAGVCWPFSSRHGQIAYLEKEGSKPGEVMSYRQLTIMSLIYWRWAFLRRRNLDRWVMS